MFMIILPLVHYIAWNYKVDETNLHRTWVEALREMKRPDTLRRLFSPIEIFCNATVVFSDKSPSHVRGITKTH